MKHLLDRLTVAWNERAVALKAMSFASIGVVNTLIDLGVFWVAYNKLGLALVPCNILSWLVAVSFSYAMNSYITFGPETGRKLRGRDYATFVASGVAGVIASTVTILVLVDYLSVSVLWAKLVSILISFAVNFSLSHFVVFRPRGSRDNAGS